MDNGKKKNRWRERKRRNRTKAPPKVLQKKAEHRILPGPARPEDNRKSSVWNYFLTSFAIITGLATLSCFVLTLISKVVVYPNAALDQRDPFHTAFILENQGYLPIYSISVATHLMRVKYGTELTIEDSQSDDSMDKFESLFPGRKATVFMRNLPERAMLPQPISPITEADAAIIVVYRPVFWSRRSEAFAFHFAKTSSGLVWFPVQAN